ncbi:MAG: hypothetical protein HN390_04290 [Anaerolineae bacterium]|jgi:hypothetical protein|nr:hypothetical protein [Anaerolineae bacterium]MBT7189468.1 hypothetical protein [Anaerolineae bacterium]
MDARKKLFLGLGGTLWFLSVLLAYAYTHKPFSPEEVFVLVRAFWQLFIGFSLVSLMGALGDKLFPAIRQEFSLLIALALQSALGMGVLGLFIFFVGVSFGFSTIFFVACFLLLSIFLRKDLFAWWCAWRALVPLWQKSTVFEKVLGWGVLFILFVTLGKSLAPPLAFDSLVYHLTLPKIYLLEGRINYLPELIFWGMPQQQEMGQAFAMVLGGTEAAIIFSWALGSLTLIGLLGYLSEKFSTQVAWVALVSLLAGQTISDTLSWGYVEWTAMLYGFSVFVLLDLWRSRREDKFLWLSALLVGFAMGTKYTTGILFVAALPIIFLTKRRYGLKSVLRDISIFAGISLLIFSPWLIKNLLATGNPVYPLLFPSGAMDVHRLTLYQGDLAWGDWRDTIFLPWRATIWGLEAKVGYSAEIGSLMLALSPLVWIGWKERSVAQKRALQTALILTLTGFLLWAVAGRTSRLLIQTRLYFVLFPTWAILAGVGFESFSKIRAGGVRFGRIASALVLLAFGFNLFLTGVNFTKLRVIETLIGAQTPTSYREHALGTYESAMFAIAELPANSQVIMLWETRGLACVPKCEPDEVIDRWYADIRNYGSPEAVLDAWREAEYTHLLFYEHGADFIREDDPAYTDADWVALEQFLSQLKLEKDFSSTYKLYSLRSIK